MVLQVLSNPNQSGILWWLSKFTGSSNENLGAGEELPVLWGFILCKCPVAFQINLRKKAPSLDRGFDDATGVVKLWFSCRASVKMLEGLEC